MENSVYAVFNEGLGIKIRIGAAGEGALTDGEHTGLLIGRKIAVENLDSGGFRHIDISGDTVITRGCQSEDRASYIQGSNIVTR